MSDSVLDAVRSKYPQYAKVDDDTLTLSLGSKYPQYLKADPKFSQRFSLLQQQRAGLKTPTSAKVLGALGTPTDILSRVSRALIGGPTPRDAAAERNAVVSGEPTLLPSDEGLWQKFRQSDTGRALLGPTSVEKEMMANGGLAGPPKGDPGVINALQPALGLVPLNRFVNLGLMTGFTANWLKNTPGAYRQFLQQLKTGDTRGAVRTAVEQSTAGIVNLMGTGAAAHGFLRPALRVDSPESPVQRPQPETILTGGNNHQEIAANAPTDLKDAAAEAVKKDENHVFVDSSGTVMDRKEAAAVIDQATGQPEGTTPPLHSEDLQQVATANKPAVQTSEPGKLPVVTSPEIAPSEDKATVENVAPEANGDVKDSSEESEMAQSPEMARQESRPTAVKLIPVTVSNEQIEAAAGQQERPPDVLDDIERITRQPVKFEEPDFADTLENARQRTLSPKGKPTVATKRLEQRISASAGEPADQVLQGLAAENPRYADWTRDDLADAMVKAHEGRELGRRGAPPSGAARGLAEQEARTQLFQKHNVKRTDAEALPVNQLFVGDRFKIQGNPVQVSEVTLDDQGQPDGVKLSGAYGEQHLPASGTVHMDENSLEGETSNIQHPTSTAEGTGELIGMGAAIPGEFPQPETPTGIKNATVDRERSSRGLPPAMATAKRSFGTVWNEAMARLDRNPAAADELVDELRHRPRAVNDEEDALLLQKQIELQNEHAKATRELAQAVDDAKQFPNRLAAAEEWKLRAAKLSDDLLDLYDVNKFVGTETARGLAARKMMAYEDYTLTKMELDKRAANDGKALTPEQQAEIQRLHDKIAATQKAFDDYRAAMEKKLAEQQFGATVEGLKGEVESGRRGAPPSGDAGTRKLDELSTIAGMKNARRQNRPARDLASYVRKLAMILIRQGITEREPLLDAVHEALVKNINPNITRRETMDAISGYGDFKALDPDEIKVKLRDLKGQMQQVAKLEDLEARRPLAKTGVQRRDVSDEERRLIQQVNEAKRKYGVVTTDPARQLKSALEAIKTRLRNRIADLDYQISTKQRIVKGKTATPYDAEAEALKARRDGLKREFDSIFGKPQMTDAQRAAAAMKAIQGNIKLYELRLAKSDFSPLRGPRRIVQTPELTAARAQRDALQEQFRQLQDLAKQPVDLQKQIEELTRQINEGEIFAQAKAQRLSRPSSPELEKLMQARDELLKIKQQLRSAANATDPNGRLQGQIDELVRRINEGEIGPRQGGPANHRPAAPDRERLLQEREALNNVLAELRKAARPKKTPDEIALQALKTRLATSTADYQERLTNKDFSPRQRQPVKLDAEAQRLKEENERAKQEFQRGLIRDRLERRTWAEKMQDTLVKWRRGFLLSSPVTLAKLTSAAVQRLAITPIEETIGSVYSRTLPSLAERAPREGGLNVRAEAKALTEGFTRGLEDAGKLLKTGRSQLGVLYGRGREAAIGEADVEPRSVIDFFGQMHGALKAPVKRAEFARSFEKRIAWNIRQGVDVSDPLVQTRIAVEAYKDANRSIFLQDNRLVSAYKRALTAFEEKNKAAGRVPLGGKAAATTARILLPIVRVPSNIVAETFQYATGLASGSARLALAMRRGIETLPPEQADMIMRHLKKGSIGAAFLLAGYLLPNAIGGYYQPGQKRGPHDVAAGTVRLFGREVPSYLLHNPLLETLQIGATIRRVADSKLRKRDTTKQGIGAGVMAGALGLTEEVPFVREMMETAKAFTPAERSQFMGELLKSLTVPALVQWLATIGDKTPSGQPVQRQPTNTAQTLETGVPGLRERVPEKISPDVTTVVGALMRTVKNVPDSQRQRMKAALTKRLQFQEDAGNAGLARDALMIRIDTLPAPDAVTAWQAADEPTKIQFSKMLMAKIQQAAGSGKIDGTTAKELIETVMPYYRQAAGGNNSSPSASGKGALYR